MARNIYDVFSEELERMHNMLQREKSQGRHSDPFATNNVHTLYARLEKMQDVLLQAVKTSDAEIQEKVAELALTSKD